MQPRNMRTAVLAALTALISGLLVTSGPAQAAGGGIQVNSWNVAVRAAGGSDILVKCTNTKTDCKGTIEYEKIEGYTPGDDDEHKRTSYSVKRGTSKYITAAMSAEQKARVTHNTQYVTGNLLIKETKPSKRTFAKDVRLTNRQYERRLTGRINGPSAGLSDMKVTLWKIKGLQTSRFKSKDVAPGGTYDFGDIPIGVNNTPTSDYRMSISADVRGERREWFWRGSWGGNGESNAGARSIATASPIRVGPSVSDDFEVNFDYGTVSGVISGPGSPGATVIVAGAPSAYPSRASDRRAMDVPFCADIFGTATTTDPNNDNGASYSVPFIPRSTASTVDRRFVVGVKPYGSQSTELWNETEFGSCLATRKYANSWDHLIGFPPGSQTLPFTRVLRNASGSIGGKVSYSGFTPSWADRNVDLRQFIPGQSVLSSPKIGGVVANSSSKQYKINDIPPGKYWLEVGRNNSCSAWYASIFPNNSAYLNGLDRGSEAWKTVNGAAAEHQKSYDMGYVKKNPPKGYKGWMYRDVCVSNGAGTYQTVWVGEDTNYTKNYTVKKGATISGKVNRGKKANEEMLVSVYSTGGALVMRSAYTSRSGSFTIRGLASGNYRVLVNGDSWRGIGRSFTGPKTKRVSAGGKYSVGTLKAKF
jgi:hypothetical protein